MKRVTAIIISAAFLLTLFTAFEAPAFGDSISPASQVGYIKRKSKKVYYRSKSGTKYAAHKTKRGTKWTAHKTKRGTKKAYVKTKTAVKN